MIAKLKLAQSVIIEADVSVWALLIIECALQLVDELEQAGRRSPGRWPCDGRARCGPIWPAECRSSWIARGPGSLFRAELER